MSDNFNSVMQPDAVWFDELVLGVGLLSLLGYVFAPVVYWLLRGFKVRCPACDGTGLCEVGGDNVAPHACCNTECQGTYVPAHFLPEGFKGILCHKTWVPREHLPPADRYGILGCGHVRGSLLARLLYGGSRDPLGHREGDDHVLPHRTLTTDVRCFYHDKENFS